VQNLKCSGLGLNLNCWIQISNFVQNSLNCRMGIINFEFCAKFELQCLRSKFELYDSNIKFCAKFFGEISLNGQNPAEM
jgi:hypothetical protein